MRAGKHVFCEKPVARTAEEAEDMIAVARECGVKFSVGHVLRFFPNYVDAASLCASGRLGTPRLIRTMRNQAFPAWSWEGWYQDYEKSGGPILDLVIHDLDWIMHSFGDVQRVYALSLGGTVPGQEHCMLAGSYTHLMWIRDRSGADLRRAPRARRLPAVRRHGRQPLSLIHI